MSQTQDAHCEHLALRILIQDPSGHWEDVDPKDLVSTVHSCVTTYISMLMYHLFALIVVGPAGTELVVAEEV